MTTRFALLIHDLPELHLDLMLGRDDFLWTWRLNRWPVVGVWEKATRIGDHRKDYLDYEGDLTGNRGAVRRILGGELQWLAENNSQIRVDARYAGTWKRWELSRVDPDRSLELEWKFRYLS